MRRSAALAALATAGAGAAFAVVNSGGASGQSPAPVTFTKQTVTVQEKDTDDFGFVDASPRTKFGKNGPRHLSPGDTLAFHSRVVDGGKTVGGLYAHCTIAHGGTFNTAAADCTGTFELPNGKLFVGVGGRKIFNGAITGAVTGGTGAYAGATGTFVSPNNNDTTDTFTIYVPSGG